MRHLFTFLSFILLVNLLSGCSPKEAFYLTKDTGSFVSSTRVAEKFTAKQTGADSFEDSAEWLMPVADSLYLIASLQPGIAVNKIMAAKNFLPVNLKKPEKNTEKQSLKQIGKVKKLQKTIYPKLTDESKPVHKLAKLGLGFSLASVGLLVLVLLVPTVPMFGLLSLLSGIAGFVISKKALKDIKNNPETYAGKGEALAGFIIGLATTILFVLITMITMLLLIAMFGG